MTDACITRHHVDVTFTKLPIYMNDIRIKNIYRKWTLL